MLQALWKHRIDAVGDGTDLFHLHPPTREGYMLCARRLAEPSEVAQVLQIELRCTQRYSEGFFVPERYVRLCPDASTALGEKRHQKEGKKCS